jgi:hypothetical protein
MKVHGGNVQVQNAALNHAQLPSLGVVLNEGLHHLGSDKLEPAQELLADPNVAGPHTVID